MISVQQGTEFSNSDYDNLKQVISIWIFTEPSEADQLTLSEIRNSQHNIIGNPTDRTNEYENNSIINICLSKDMDKCVHFNSDIHRFLGTVFSETIPVEMKKEILHNKFNIPMNEEIDRRLIAIHNGISQGIKRRAIEEGRREGVATVIKVLLSKGYGTDFIINLGYTQEDIDMAINLNTDNSQSLH